jgi:hypothetical protein
MEIQYNSDSVEGDGNFFNKCYLTLCSTIRIPPDVNNGVKRSNFPSYVFLDHASLDQFWMVLMVVPMRFVLVMCVLAAMSSVTVIRTPLTSIRLFGLSSLK